VIMPAVALMSAFTHHVTTTAVMLPVTLDLARERRIPASKLLMPLAISASLGTTATIIGAPAFLIADEVLKQAGRPGLQIFSIAPIGLTLIALSIVFMMTVGRWLLPALQANDDAANRFRLDRYFTELTILPGSPFLRKTIAEVEQNPRFSFTVVGWVRDKQRIRRPFGAQRLQAGDVLLIRTTPEEIVSIRQERGVELHAVAKYGTGLSSVKKEDADMLVQAVVAPDSELLDRSLGELAFKQRYGAIVVGLWRRVGWLQQQLARIKLKAGDVLVLQGDSDALNRIAADKSFLMLVPFVGERKVRGKAGLASLIMLSTIVTAACGLMRVEMASLCGALLVVLTGCISVREAYRTIDARIYVFIAGAVPLGIAMQRTGTADLVARFLEAHVSGWSEHAVLLLLFAVVAIATQFMSDAGTTAIFAPVSVAVAKRLGHPPEPYAVTVAMAAVAAFITPIGHHGNLLVYGPGRYRFSDFVKVGTPLTLIVAAVVVLMTPLLWPQ
jgi:di/tricarboxylate transporter